MAVEIPVDKWTGKIREVKLGGGGRKEGVLGGASTLPYIKFEGEPCNPTRIAITVHDSEPPYPPGLLSSWGDVVKDPGEWAKKAVEVGADIICLRLTSAHPETGNTGAGEAKAERESGHIGGGRVLGRIAGQPAVRDDDRFGHARLLVDASRAICLGCASHVTSGDVRLSTDGQCGTGQSVLPGARSVLHNPDSAVFRTREIPV